MRPSWRGTPFFFMDGYDQAMKIAGKGYPNMGVSGAETEKVLRGSREGFTDAVKMNSALVRKRIRDTRLKVVEKTLGVRSRTVVQILYIDDLAQEELLEELKSRMDEYEIDGILDSGMLEQLTEENWYSPFPQYQTTERPDRAAQELLNGKAVVICDNSPYALILPALSTDLWKAARTGTIILRWLLFSGCSDISPWRRQRFSQDCIWR